MTIDTPYLLPQESLTLPQNPAKKHPLPKLRLAAMKLAGAHCRQRSYHPKQSVLSAAPGEMALINNTKHTWTNGQRFVVRGKSISFRTPIHEFLTYLTELYHQGNLQYSAMNTARSAVSTVLVIDGQPAGQHPLTRRFMRGIFNQKPALPRYNAVWDLNDVITHLRTLAPVNKLDLKQLSKKLLMLLLILSGQRAQTMHLLDVKNLTLSYSKAIFVIGDVTKTTAPGRHIEPLCFLAYAPDRRLCAVTVLKHYLERTLDIRGTETRLFLTLNKTNKAPSKDTLRRWAKDMLRDSGVNIDTFKPHSVRSAASSLAAKTNLSIDTIMRAAGWLQETTFSKYYKMPIKSNFGQHILHVAN